MSAEIHVRPMLQSDLAWVAALEAQVQAFPWSETSFADSLHAGHGAWVAERSSAPGQDRGQGSAAPCGLGFAVAMQVLDEAHLLNIGVAPAWHRQGTGRLLLRAVENRLAAAGARCMLLEVRLSNLAAQAFYRGAGFSEIGRRRAYYPALRGREDAVVMRREWSQEACA